MAGFRPRPLQVSFTHLPDEGARLPARGHGRRLAAADDDPPGGSGAATTHEPALHGDDEPPGSRQLLPADRARTHEPTLHGHQGGWVNDEPPDSGQLLPADRARKAVRLPRLREVLPNRRRPLCAHLPTNVLRRPTTHVQRAALGTAALGTAALGIAALGIAACSPCRRAPRLCRRRPAQAKLPPAPDQLTRPRPAAAQHAQSAMYVYMHTCACAYMP